MFGCLGADVARSDVTSSKVLFNVLRHAREVWELHTFNLSMMQYCSVQHKVRTIKKKQICFARRLLLSTTFVVVDALMGSVKVNFSKSLMLGVVGL